MGRRGGARVCGVCKRGPGYDHELTLCPNCLSISLCDDCYAEHISQCGVHIGHFRHKGEETRQPSQGKYLSRAYIIGYNPQGYRGAYRNR